MSCIQSVCTYVNILILKSCVHRSLYGLSTLYTDVLVAIPGSIARVNVSPTSIQGWAPQVNALVRQLWSVVVVRSGRGGRGLPDKPRGITSPWLHSLLGGHFLLHGRNWVMKAAVGSVSDRQEHRPPWTENTMLSFFKKKF